MQSSVLVKKEKRICVRSFLKALPGVGVCCLMWLVSGCAEETIVHGLSEKEANIILEVMSDADMRATKLINATGREVVYDISVPAADRIKAIKLLNRHELPRRRDKGYFEVFSQSGLVPTSAEEKAKKMMALEGEIERQLKLIEGVLDVQVQLVIPEESALRTTNEQGPDTTASVTIKYLPGAQDSRPVTEPEVQAIVAAGVEKLMPENVVVLMRPTGGAAPSVAVPPPPQEVRRGLQALSNKALSIGLVTFLVMIALLGAGLVATQIRLRAVRGRFIRLQNEIAKARQKKPGEGTGSSQVSMAPTGTSN